MLTLLSSAYEYCQWWEHEIEGNHVDGRAWAYAGWNVDGVDFNEQWGKLVCAGQGV